MDESVAQLSDRRRAVVNSLVGWVMRRRPAANPHIVRKIVVEMLEARSRE